VLHQAEALSFLPLDSWCGGETGEGDGLARRDDQEAGDDLGKGATFINFLGLFHCEFLGILFSTFSF